MSGLFFAREAAALEEALQRADAGPDALLGKPGLKLAKRDVRRLVQQREDQPAIALDAPDRRSPPSVLGPKLPSRRRRSAQRMALAALIPNRSAAWRHDIPPSTAASTRLRRSFESAVAIHAGPLRQHAA
jgi:hypothetical protein